MELNNLLYANVSLRKFLFIHTRAETAVLASYSDGPKGLRLLGVGFY